LIVSFNTQDLRNCCASLEKAEATIGSVHASELISLLADGETVDTAAELIDLYKPSVIMEGKTIAISIGAKICVLLAALGKDLGNPVNWSEARRLKMMDFKQC